MLKLNTELLRSFRARNKLSFYKAGAAVGVTGQAWWYWERGVCFPIFHLDSLAHVLGIAQANLILEDGHTKRKSRASPPGP